MLLRTYQREAVDAVFSYWQEEPGNPLVEMATGTGKSLVLSELTQHLIAGWPDMRVATITHVQELIEQSYKELLGIWPFAPAGIYSAGLGRRDSQAQILFGGIQSVHNKVDRIGCVDVLIVDECHLIPANADTMYGRFIAGLREVNDDLKILGLTATPYRLDSGRLDDGESRLFDRVVYKYGIADGIADGYLSRLVSKGMTTGFDLTGVGTRGGDYVPGALQRAVDKAETTASAVREIVAYGEGQSRKTWLCFCAGVDHAFNVAAEIRNHGVSCETLTGETPKGERREIIEALKAGTLRAVTNDNILTTGTNIPGIDLIADLAPTKSVSRYVQKAGRGTRPIYAPGFDMGDRDSRLAAIEAGPKRDCLYLDFAGNTARHGPVDTVEPRKPGEGDGEPPIKMCPIEEGGCASVVHASARTCPDCGFQFPEPETQLSSEADAAPVLSKAEPEWINVNWRGFYQHDKPDKPSSVKTEYGSGMMIHREWLCPGHSGYAKSKADRYWNNHGGKRPFPRSCGEWLERQGELLETVAISVRPNGKYWDIVGHEVGSEKQEELTPMAPAAQIYAEDWEELTF